MGENSTTLKERPILFSGEMVRAILEGRKTQTRRVVKSSFTITELATAEAWDRGRHNSEMVSATVWGPKRGNVFVNTVEAGVIGLGCPFGKPGDLLWVREAFAESFKRDHDTRQLVHYKWNYRADEEVHKVDGVFVCRIREDGKPIKTMADLFKWSPSIHMPREASRITLEITNVRVERLQNISAADIEAEGTPKNPMQQAVYRNDLYQRRKDFEFLWDKINGSKSPWESNPWVWVIGFKKMEDLDG